jgi:hypothetical protein
MAHNPVVTRENYEINLAFDYSSKEGQNINNSVFRTIITLHL